jgi:hypothetical protein
MPMSGAGGVSTATMPRDRRGHDVASVQPCSCSRCRRTQRPAAHRSRAHRERRQATCRCSSRTPGNTDDGPRLPHGETATSEPVCSGSKSSRATGVALSGLLRAGLELRSLRHVWRAPPENGGRRRPCRHQTTRYATTPRPRASPNPHHEHRRNPGVRTKSRGWATSRAVQQHRVAPQGCRNRSTGQWSGQVDYPEALRR